MGRKRPIRARSHRPHMAGFTPSALDDRCSSRLPSSGSHSLRGTAAACRSGAKTVAAPPTGSANQAAATARSCGVAPLPGRTMTLGSGLRALQRRQSSQLRGPATRRRHPCAARSRSAAATGASTGGAPRQACVVTASPNRSHRVSSMPGSHRPCPCEAITQRRGPERARPCHPCLRHRAARPAAGTRPHCARALHDPRAIRSPRASARRQAQVRAA